MHVEYRRRRMPGSGRPPAHSLSVPRRCAPCLPHHRWYDSRMTACWRCCWATPWVSCCCCPSGKCEPLLQAVWHAGWQSESGALAEQRSAACCRTHPWHPPIHPVARPALPPPARWLHNAMEHGWPEITIAFALGALVYQLIQVGRQRHVVAPACGRRSPRLYCTVRRCLLPCKQCWLPEGPAAPSTRKPLAGEPFCSACLLPAPPDCTPCTPALRAALHPRVWQPPQP